MFCRTLCDDSYASSLVPNPLESRVLTNWRFWVLEKTPILFDLPLISHDLLIFWERSLGDMFTGQLWRYPPSFVGFRLHLLEIQLLKSCSRVFWERPVWPVPSTDLTGVTGLTGELNQSERSLQSSSAFWLVLLPHSSLGRCCSEIASPQLFSHFLGVRDWGDFWDIGRRIDFKRNFDRLSFTPPLVASFGPSMQQFEFHVKWNSLSGLLSLEQDCKL